MLPWWRWARRYRCISPAINRTLPTDSISACSIMAGARTTSNGSQKTCGSGSGYMLEMNSKSATRTERILRELRQAGAISVEQLCALLDVSVATVRRDLQELEEKGLLRRTHGGAVSIEPLFYEPFRHDSSFQEQIGRHAEEK